MNTPPLPRELAAIIRGFYYVFDPQITKIASYGKSRAAPKNPKSRPQKPIKMT